MPSHTEKQAKVMSAISHGWEPSHGDVAKIPLKVAKDFHAADAGHKYGKGHDKKKHKAIGGGLKVAYEIRRADGGQVFEGPIVSSVPGRTDHHPMDVGSGAYVLPAETVSHLGESNSLAGLDALHKMGPDGLKKLVHKAWGKRTYKAKGGAATSHNLGKPIPINAAGGEFVVPPSWVHHIGDGDVKKAHAMLDHFVMDRRKHHVSTLKALKPPAQD